MHAQVVSAADHMGVPLPQEIATSRRAPQDIPDYESLRDEYVNMLPQFPDGTSELFLHRSADTRWARDRFGVGWIKRVWELQLLGDPIWLEALKESGIELVASW